LSEHEKNANGCPKVEIIISKIKHFEIIICAGCNLCSVISAILLIYENEKGKL
jgi:hypothetical protein